MNLSFCCGSLIMLLVLARTRARVRNLGFLFPFIRRRGEVAHMECACASGFLTYFTLHSIFAPELNKRTLGVLLCIYNNRLLYICILHGKPRRTDAKMLMSKIPLKPVLRRTSETHLIALLSRGEFPVPFKPCC